MEFVEQQINADGPFLLGGKPFFLVPETPAKQVVICVHGHGATPHEVRPVADALVEQGFVVVGPAVRGHALSPEVRGIEEFRKTKWINWLESLRNLISFLHPRFDRVFLYGQSMGGALCLYLASEGCIDGVATTAPALRLPRILELISPLFKFIDRTIPAKEHSSPFTPSYTVHSSKSGYHLTKLARETRKRLHLITCPVLVCHSHNDKTVPASKVPPLIQKTVPGPVIIKWFENSGHLLPLDVDGPAVVQAIIEFFLSIERKS